MLYGVEYILLDTREKKMLMVDLKEEKNLFRFRGEKAFSFRGGNLRFRSKGDKALIQI